MGKLHQLLAVHDSLMNVFKKTVEEGVSTFSKKENLFQGLVSETVSKLDQEDPRYAEFPNHTETVPVAETVPSKLSYILEHAAKYFDASCQIDEANCAAKADVILDNGTVLAKNLPAVTILFLENKFKTIRGLVEAVPTLDPAKNWAPREGMDNVFANPSAQVPVMEVVREHVVVAPHTDKHPAQVAVTEKKVVRAIKTTTNLSGRISTLEKSKILHRCDQLINALKKARQTANDVDHSNRQISDAFVSFLMGK